MKRIAFAVIALLLLLTACRSDPGIDATLADMLIAEKDNLLVAVWGSYPFTERFQSGERGDIGVPVTRIGEDGFRALAGGHDDRAYQMLVVSNEVIDDSLFTESTIADFNALLDRGAQVFFITGGEDQGNQIAEHFTGGAVECSDDPAGSYLRLYVCGFFRVLPGDDPPMQGMDDGDCIPLFIYGSKTDSAAQRADTDSQMLYKLFFKYE